MPILVTQIIDKIGSQQHFAKINNTEQGISF